MARASEFLSILAARGHPGHFFPLVKLFPEQFFLSYIATDELVNE